MPGTATVLQALQKKGSGLHQNTGRKSL